MSSDRLFRWTDRALVEVDALDSAEYAIEAADSLLASDGRAFALELHRARFMDAVESASIGREQREPGEVEAFWSAAFAMVPPRGDWFPRVELHSSDGETHLSYRQRKAPELTRAVTLLSHHGPDPRRMPSIKGPDLAALVSMRTAAQEHGADDAVILTADGHIIDGATNALVWWRGETLCGPPPGDADPKFARVASITAQSILGLAPVLGIETRAERALPAYLDGCEVWALNALHGIRMVTGWVGGPELAEMPGRIKGWRDRREALRTPMGGLTSG